MKKNLIMCLATILFSLGLFNTAYAKETNYDVIKVTIESSDCGYNVISNNKTLYFVSFDPRYVEPTCNVNIRSVPNTKVDRYSVINKGTCLLSLGNNNSWELIYINNSYYFIKDKYITSYTGTDAYPLSSIEKCTECEDRSQKDRECDDQVETQSADSEGMSYLGKWRVTEYCKKCNSGSSYQTASGAKASIWYTCAVSHSNYKKWKGKTLYVEGWGYFKIQDWGSVSGCNKNEWVDLFLPSSYHNHVWDKCKVYLVN